MFSVSCVCNFKGIFLDLVLSVDINSILVGMNKFTGLKIIFLNKHNIIYYSLNRYFLLS